MKDDKALTEIRTQDVERSVRERYSEAAQTKVAALCCPIDYNPKYLEMIPKEILERDYGCGDPSRFLREGDRVLDLGSGSGKICYIASQIVGTKGSVVGVDMNSDMLTLARKYQPEIVDRLGYSNVEFRRGKIQDLALDLDRVEEHLYASPIIDVDSMQEFVAFQEHLRRSEPMISDRSIDVIVSNCVLNLVRQEDRRQLFSEMYRVLKQGGRIAISDIVSDEEVPEHLKRNGELWSGCIAGAFTEEGFLQAIEDAGFYGAAIAKWDEKPWQTIEGIEFRSVTIVAFKGKEGACLERNQAVIYKGPWKSVTDDDGHTLNRGQRMAVCDKTYHVYTNPNGPYVGQAIGVEPYQQINLEGSSAFNCRKNAKRHPRETKGMDYTRTELAGSASCGSDECC
ncbi:MAG: methyltransferase domain-containing protein [Ignavibacteriae bacterium]|nr:methyltransferase domain-containing protein [Ignavibacteriota bacterium]